MRAIRSILEFQPRPALIIIAAASHLAFGTSSTMLQRRTPYPIKMAAAIICQLSLVSLLVWMSL